ncbi:RluA family pseudouridine synthase [uncultured Campylobacter sp.]|mgnify:CR=1 FL=1|uniref:pseudouridine synthase n=1 Tax=uncultured Campylobacter sp. TaxID=218934 RepID=UPI00262415BC|nr:RluA family pseudouridine synthase [uncultured Campylobacter sp.]
MGYEKRSLGSFEGRKIYEILLSLGYDMKSAQRICDKHRVTDAEDQNLHKNSVARGEIFLIDYKCEPRGLKPIFECDAFAAFDKPSGILSHPSGRNSPYNMYDEIWSLYGQDACVAHRLDLETSGILIVAKNKDAARELKECFEQRRVMKSYLALVRGDLQSAACNGEIENCYALGSYEICGSKFADDAVSLPSSVSDLRDTLALKGVGNKFGFNILSNGASRGLWRSALSGGAQAKFKSGAPAGDVGSGFEFDALFCGVSDKLKPAIAMSSADNGHKPCALPAAKSLLATSTGYVNFKKFEPAKYAKFSEKLKFLKDFEGFVIDAPIAPSDEFADLKIRMKISRDGKEAITLIRPLRYLSDIDASLIECYPLTGRQHQIRLHLFAAGAPILGEPLYGLSREQAERILDKKMDETERIRTTGAPRLLLHANAICFELSGERYEIKSKFDAAKEFYNLAKIGKI